MKYIFGSLHVSGRVSKWQVIFSEYDVKHCSRKAIKGIVIADHLPANPVDEYQRLDFHFPTEDIQAIEEDDDEEDEDKNIWKMFLNNVINAHGNDIEVVLIALDGNQFLIAVELQFDCTNNKLEDEACVNVLQASINIDVKHLKIFGDLALIIYQVTGNWQTKKDKLVPYKDFLT